MLYLTNQKRIQINRQYHFHLIIHLARMQTHSLIDLFPSSNFTSQKLLESVLLNLIIMDRGRRISLKDFDGQLESDSAGIPYWNVYLKTTALITSRCLAKAISEELFKTNKVIDPAINITPLINFQRCNRKRLFSVPEAGLYPGHFNKTVLKFDELLENEQVKEAIRVSPDKYKFLLKD